MRRSLRLALTLTLTVLGAWPDAAPGQPQGQLTYAMHVTIPGDGLKSRP